jgi:hypothetical protein
MKRPSRCALHNMHAVWAAWCMTYCMECPALLSRRAGRQAAGEGKWGPILLLALLGWEGSGGSCDGCGPCSTQAAFTGQDSAREAYEYAHPKRGLYPRAHTSFSLGPGGHAVICWQATAGQP